MKGQNFSIIIIQILLVVLLLSYIIARSKGLSVILFWPIFWALVFVSLIIIFKLPSKYKLVSLIILATSINLLPIIALPEIYQIGRDDMFESQFTSVTLENGNWNPTLGSGFAQNYYGYNPVLHFILSFASLTTGIDVFVISKYFFFAFLRILLVLFTFMLVNTFLGKKNSNITYLATFLFAGSAGIAFLGVSRRTIASIFLILTIYTIVKSNDIKNKILWDLLYMVFSFMVVIANHSIAYYLLMFLAGAWIFSLLVRRVHRPIKEEENIFPEIFYKLVYFLTVFVLWELLVGKILLMNDIKYIKELFNVIATGTGVNAFFRGSQDFGVNIYRPYETFIIYSAQFMFVLFSLIGLFFFVRRLQKGTSIINILSHNYFLSYFGIFGISMYIFSSLLMRTVLDVAVIIILWFFSIPICIFIAYLFENITRKAMLKKVYLSCTSIAIIFLFTGSMLMGSLGPRLSNRAPSEDVVLGTDIRSKSAELYFSASWLAKNRGSNNRVVGDVDVFEIYNGFFHIDVNTYPSYTRKIYKGSDNEILSLISRNNLDFGTYAHTRYRDNVDYFVINNAFSKYHNHEFTYPISLTNTNKLDNIRALDKIYNNNAIQIYQVNRGS